LKFGFIRHDYNSAIAPLLCAYKLIRPITGSSLSPFISSFFLCIEFNNKDQFEIKVTYQSIPFLKSINKSDLSHSFFNPLEPHSFLTAKAAAAHVVARAAYDPAASSLLRFFWRDIDFTECAKLLFTVITSY